MAGGMAPAGVLRVRSFVDFWNFQLSVNECYRAFKLDWRALGHHLAAQAGAAVGQPVANEGLHVYLSYNPNSPKDRGLVAWATNTLDCFPGVSVVTRERKTKAPPKCPTCQHVIETCTAPGCGASMSGTVEKGIDTAIATDMIKMAWEKSFDVGVLVSSDRDFVPVVEFLGSKGYRIVNARFKPRGSELARCAWASFDLSSGLPPR